MKDFLNSIIEGLARFGCGLAGIAHPPPDHEETHLP
jgi:hypothetical protein